MSPKHINPTQPRWDEKQKREQWARASYNFVPLPDKTVKAQLPPKQDIYEGYTGWIDCELETCSPMYMRGMLTEAQYAAYGNTPPDQLTEEQKLEHAPFFSSSQELVEGRPKPAIPGSSLRGMLRTLVEIAGYGKIRWVTKEDKVFFRAVAASKSDPLSSPYKNMLKNVRVGYLVKKGENWFIQPAHGGKENYLKVREEDVLKSSIKFIPMSSSDYRPQYVPVRFTTMQTPKGRLVVDQIGPRDASPKSWMKGVMVCSGNMRESNRETGDTQRCNHWVIPEPDPKVELRIDPQAVKDYQSGLTPFQRSDPFDPVWGCLIEGRPIFYCDPGPGDVTMFGHTRNFRIPARSGGKGAVAPYDMIPAALRQTTDAECDLADTIFGWTPELNSDRKTSCAGRVFVRDARMIGAQDGVWFKPTPITPHVLSGPKPTTFQHYLVQDSKRGHNPDNKVSLANYATPLGETQIRGHKLYWHKGRQPDIEATAQEKEHESQLSRMIPVKAGVKFAFRLWFENLRPEELGAILWVLNLPGSDKVLRHKIGMGKPLGMGAVAIKIAGLHMPKRQDRYMGLFDEKNTWRVGQEAPVDLNELVKAFEEFVTRQIGVEGMRLAELERIQMMFKLMEWPGDTPDPTWVEWTRYMQIEHPENGNEYKERPVLPDPLGVGVPVSGRRAPAPRREEAGSKPSAPQRRTPNARQGRVGSSRRR